MKEVQPRETITATIAIPGSKSLSHRALIAATLASGKSRLFNLLECEDTIYTLKALQGLGIEITNDNGITTIAGKGGRFPVPSGTRTLFLGNSGTSLRLMLSTAALARGETILTGSARLQERPVGELVRALRDLGVQDISASKDNFPPVRLHSQGMKGGKARLTGRESSQYLSALLLAAPCAGTEVKIEVDGSIVSSPYVDLTLEVMDRFGVRVEREGYSRFKVPVGPGYRPADYQVEGDASSASYFWSAAAVTGGTVATENVFPESSRQGDMSFLDLLEKMGARVGKEARGAVVQGRTLAGIEADMSAMPDMVPTLAALALFAKGKTVIRNVAHLRLKESDRLQAVSEEWLRLGARIEELPDGLIIEGSVPLNGALCDPRNDHRLAMSLAVIGLRVPGIRIRQAECVNKSFPLFWDYWDRL